MQNPIQQFVEKFFKNLNATISLENNSLKITNVPEAFQKYYGKKEPYLLTFEPNSNPEIEFIDKSNYLIQAISGYLDSSGKTTLLKIDFDVSRPDKILNLIKTPNASLGRANLLRKNSIFFRFTFHTVFQYLNEREKIINEIYTSEDKIIDGDLKGYPVVEGSKSDIKIPDPKEAYSVAKGRLKNIIETRTQMISEELNQRLEKEIDRVETHFRAENREDEENLRRNLVRLEQAKAQEDFEKIQRQGKLIQELKAKINPEDASNEKQRAIQLEMQRHMLNINNKLFNTTLIYYPLLAYSVSLENTNAKRNFEISLDLLTGKPKFPKCDVCSEEINELVLCSGNHIICKKCGDLCEACGKVYCNTCLKVACPICSKKICKDCYIRCDKCGKNICTSHTKKDTITNKTFCVNCLKRCERCSQPKNPRSFKISPRTEADICEDCYRTEMQSRAVEGVFEDQ
jgi:hypothetical protein